MTRNELVQQLHEELVQRTMDSFAFSEACKAYATHEYHCSEIGMRAALLRYLECLPK